MRVLLVHLRQQTIYSYTRREPFVVQQACDSAVASHEYILLLQTAADSAVRTFVGRGWADRLATAVSGRLALFCVIAYECCWEGRKRTPPRQKIMR